MYIQKKIGVVKVYSYKGLDCITELNKVLQPGFQRGNNKHVFHKIPAYNKTYSQLNPTFISSIKRIKHAMEFFLRNCFSVIILSSGSFFFLSVK